MDPHIITDLNNFDAQKITFTDKSFWTPAKTKFPKFFFKYQYPNGSVDSLIVQFPILHSFGVKKFVNKRDEGNVDSWSAIFTTFNPEERLNNEPNEQTAQEDKFNKVLNEIVERVKAILCDNLSKLGKKKDYSDRVNRMAVLRQRINKNHNGDVVEEDVDPNILYVKISTGNLYEPATQFYIADKEQDGTKALRPISHSEMLPQLEGTTCSAFGLLKFDSVFCGTEPSFQIKLIQMNILEMKKRIPTIVSIPKYIQNSIKMFEDEEEK